MVFWSPTHNRDTEGSLKSLTAESVQLKIRRGNYPCMGTELNLRKYMFMPQEAALIGEKNNNKDSTCIFCVYRNISIFFLINRVHYNRHYRKEIIRRIIITWSLQLCIFTMPSSMLKFLVSHCLGKNWMDHNIPRGVWKIHVKLSSFFGFLSVIFYC